LYIAVPNRLMRHLITIVSICYLCSFTAFAQNNFNIKGLVADTTSKTMLDGATICVVNAKDSVLQKFTYTSNGLFNISDLKAGKYLLIVSYSDYADYTENFTLDAAKPTHNFGNISVISRSRLLNEVIVKSKLIPIKIKGDTTIFNAAAYITQKNAKVDELLKQLPGMRINQSGVITFQGETVSKILVDGEEFFSDDPTLVSKTVRADMVANVQVYDQKSEVAKQTGIEDGIKVKTINLQLREDKKKGIFGKLEADYGTRDFYTGQAMFNKFSPKEKIAAYGNLANTGRIGLSGGDANKFGSGFSAGYGGVGMPVARDGGFHYDNKWNKDKQSINGNYKISALDVDVVGNTITQNNLPGNFNKSVQDRTSHDYNFFQTADANLTSIIDSTSNISLQVSGREGHNDSKNMRNTTTYRSNGIVLNSNENNTINSNDNKYVNMYTRYFKRLNKKGRNISVFGGLSYNQSGGDEYLKSNLTLYDEFGVAGTPVVTDQYKPSDFNTNSLSAGVSFTEPLSKTITLTTGYNVYNYINNNSRLSYNKSLSGVYDALDTQFSSDFGTKTFTNTYNISTSYRQGKLTAYVSTSVANASFKQTDKLLDTMLTRDFINWAPNASVYYQLTKAASFSISYSGYTSQPSILQIQPLRQNADPLNITIGNPGLRPEFSNNFNFNYRVYQAVGDQGVNFRGSYSNRINAILRNRTTDANGVNTYQWTNLEGEKPSNWRLYLEFYGHVTKADFLLSPSFVVNGSTYYNYINNQLNRTRSVTYNPGVSINQNRTNYSYYFDVGMNYTANNTTLQNINNNTRGYFAHLNLFTKLPFNFFVGDECSYEFTGKNQVFADDFQRVLLKVYLGKNFLKDETLKVTVTGNDLFNQNTGYSRSGTQDSFTEERHNTIRRYFMLSVTWDFSKFGKSLQK
jgi:hypothetical protein